MCGFFNSNKNRMASVAVSRRGNMRSPMAQNRRMMRIATNDHINGNNISNNNSITEERYITKDEYEKINLGFTGYSLKYQNISIIADIEYIIPQYQHDIDPNTHNLIRNDIFEGIKADKIAIVYSPKKKQFLIMGLNDDYSSCILFKSSNFHDLPIDIDLDNLHPNIQIIENTNRLMNAVYNRIKVADFTSNPIHFYRTNEIFKL